MFATSGTDRNDRADPLNPRGRELRGPLFDEPTLLRVGHGLKAGVWEESSRALQFTAQRLTTQMIHQTVGSHDLKYHRAAPTKKTSRNVARVAVA